MRLIPIALIIITLIATASAQSTIAPEEYRVYNAVMKSIYREEGKHYSSDSYYVIYRNTKTDEDLRLDLAKSYPGLTEDFLDKNKQSAQLESKLVFGKFLFVDELDIKNTLPLLRKKSKPLKQKRKKITPV